MAGSSISGSYEAARILRDALALRDHFHRLPLRHIPQYADALGTTSPEEWYERYYRRLVDERQIHDEMVRAHDPIFHFKISRASCGAATFQFPTKGEYFAKAARLLAELIEGPEVLALEILEHPSAPILA